MENGGARRDRTDDLKLAKLPLSQLSYSPEFHDRTTHLLLLKMVGRGRFELPTSRLSVVRSNQLSYRPPILHQPKLHTADQARSVQFAEERETKVAAPATMCRYIRDLDEPFVLKNSDKTEVNKGVSLERR